MEKLKATKRIKIQDAVECRGPRTRRDILYLVIQFLNEINLGGFAQMIKEKTGVLFSTHLFEVMVKQGRWEKAEAYISFFGRSPEEQLYISNIRYEMSKHKYLEALLRSDRNNAEHILENEILVLDLNETMILEDMWDVQDLARNILQASSEKHIEMARATLVRKLKNLIEETPCLQENYGFGHLQLSSLWELVDKRYLFGRLRIRKPSSVSRQQHENHPSTLSSGSSSSNSARRFKEGRNLGDGNRGLNEEGGSSSTSLKLIKDSTELQSLRLLANVLLEKEQILRLTYTNSGTAIFALLSSGLNLVWKWPRTDLNPSGKATPTIPAENPMRYMLNDWPDAFPKTDISCFALSSDDSFLLSASNGGEISMFNPSKFEKMQAKWSFTPPPPSATSLAVLPHDNTIVAVGRDDGTIEVYNSAAANEVIKLLKGHTERITGLAFSETINSLVSSGADAKIVVWSMDNWQKKVQRSLNIPSDRPVAAMSKTEIQFHRDEIRLLVVHETQLAILEATTLECKKQQWIVGQFEAPIHYATFSFNGDLIYSGFLDGALCIFRVSADSLQLWCRINPSAYIPSFRSSDQYSYPLVFAAHPHNPHQIAVGLTDGQVYVLEITLPPG